MQFIPPPCTPAHPFETHHNATISWLVHDLILFCTMHSNPFGYWFAWSKTGYAFQTKSEDVTVASWNNLFLHIPVLLSSKPKPSSKGACLHWWTTTTGVNVSFMGWRRGSTFFSFFLCFIIMVRPPSDDEWATFRKIIFFSALATWAWVCACMGGGGGSSLDHSRAQELRMARTSLAHICMRQWHQTLLITVLHSHLYAEFFAQLGSCDL